MKVTYTRTIEVDNDVAIEVGYEFLMWLENNGHVLVKGDASLLATDPNELESIHELAQNWIAEQ